MTSSLNQSEIVLYTTTDGKVKIDTVFQNKTIWLTQAKMAELFDVQRPAVTKHLKNIFESGELVEQVVSSILEHTTQHGAMDGKTTIRSVKYYNHYAIIAVGCRVNSQKAEALAADDEDIKRHEEIEQKLLEKRDKKK